MQQVEKWGMLELEFYGKSDGNPFIDYEIHAEFQGENETKKVVGFYDGNGIYKVRFMPSYEGTYSYHVDGNFIDENTESDLQKSSKNKLCGEFVVIEPISKTNHGPVHVLDERYLEYSDETPYYSIGTTCYAWVHQNDTLQEQTLRTLANSSFNKIRFCIFPKYYRYNEGEPKMYPYIQGNKRGIDEERAKKSIRMSFHTSKEIKDITDFDCYQFNVGMFQKFDQRILELRDMGIEADLILMHPYDKWGFSNMTMECDQLYLNYCIARFAAYRNVWWSMANEYDLTTKTKEDWEELAHTVKTADPYDHMISIHNCIQFYDYHKNWISHCSMQRIDLYKDVELTSEYLQEYNKPVVWDEICYEGNISMGWGNISGQEMVRRFWETFVRGGYAGHGETYENENEILWWSHGGVLHGTSEPRFTFLKKIMEETPGKFLKESKRMFDEIVGIPYQTIEQVRHPFFDPVVYADYELHYYTFTRPSNKEFEFPEDEKFQIDVIDTWNMTITDMGIHSGYTRIELPGREFMAIRIRKRND